MTQKVLRIRAFVSEHDREEEDITDELETTNTLSLTEMKGPQ